MNEEVIRRRLSTYYEDTYKTLSFYPPEIVFEVDAGQCMIDVLRDIVNRLSEVKSRPTLRNLLTPVTSGYDPSEVTDARAGGPAAGDLVARGRMSSSDGRGRMRGDTRRVS